MKQSFCPIATIKAGHFFCYDEDNNTITIINGKKHYVINKKTKRIPQELEEFFDLNKNFSFLEQHPELQPYNNIRLVRQDLRQAILTFITTANNNQKRIKKLLDALRSLGEELSPGVKTLPKDFSEEQLRNLGFGYRAKTLAQTNQLLTEEFLEKIRQSNEEEQRALLLTLPGVGPKVADCILAYSELASPYAFPQDVWVLRAVKRRHKLKNYSYNYVRAFAKKRFKEHASYIQHYYFLDEQNKK